MSKLEARDLDLIGIALEEATLSRDDILRYHVKHPDVHDPKDIEIYTREVEEMKDLFKKIVAAKKETR